ncbi:IS30 family transposase, partial [Lactiplantibacillus paraplantarum]
MSSITYSERIKIETFCELGLVQYPNEQSPKNDHLPKFSYELARCEP